VWLRLSGIGKHSKFGVVLYRKPNDHIRNKVDMNIVPQTFRLSAVVS
jgi:hypothetical protein